MDDNPILLNPTLYKQLKGHQNAVTALYFSPDEQRIASSSLDNTVFLWDLSGNLRSYRFRGHSEAVMDVTFSPSGKHMATASRDKTVRLWVPSFTGSTGMFRAHSQTVRSVQFTSDESKLLTASDDKIVKLWSTNKYKFLASFVGHTNWVRCARIASDGSVIASCSDDKTTKLWDPDSGELLHTYKDQKGYGLYVAWHPSGCYIAVGTSHGTVKLYDIRTHKLVQYYSVHNGPVTQVAFHPSGSYILTASHDAKMKILGLLEGHPMFTLSGHMGGINAVNFSTNGEGFASAGEDKLVNLWKTNFTELASDDKENLASNSPITYRSSQSSKVTSTYKTRKQGKRYWYLCYHSTRYPKTNFVALGDEEPLKSSSSHNCYCPNNTLESVLDPPVANSTITDNITIKHFESERSTRDSTCSRGTNCQDFCNNNIQNQSPTCNNDDCPFNEPRCNNDDCSSNDVGHASHIPRQFPPKPSTYTIPSIVNKSREALLPDVTGKEDLPDTTGKEELFGIIKLKHNDVCYTNGIIEWVGRKRNYPINSGFKILSDTHGQVNEITRKKPRTQLDTFDNKTIDCPCLDILPTVNAIVDHLNALHEAVDIVDLRLNNLEEVLSSRC